MTEAFTTRQVASQLDCSDPVRVLLIGAGGNGSEVFDGLLKIHVALREAFDLPGLEVVVLDDDTVAAHNVLRQRFYPHEVGVHKSVALGHRVNMTFGTNWQGLPRRFHAGDTALVEWADVVITAVDTLSARRAVHQAVQKGRARGYWLDLGVDKAQGQVVFGHLRHASMTDELPNVIAHFPEILYAEDRHDVPSCSAADSLARQDLFVNQTAAMIASQLLWQVVRHGVIARNGAVFDLAEGSQRSLPLVNLQPAGVSHGA